MSDGCTHSSMKDEWIHKWMNIDLIVSSYWWELSDKLPKSSFINYTMWISIIKTLAGNFWEDGSETVTKQYYSVKSYAIKTVELGLKSPSDREWLNSKAIYESMKKRLTREIEENRENLQTPFFPCSPWTFQFLGTWQFRGEDKAHGCTCQSSSYSAHQITRESIFQMQRVAGIAVRPTESESQRKWPGLFSHIKSPQVIGCVLPLIVFS